MSINRHRPYIIDAKQDWFEVQLELQGLRESKPPSVQAFQNVRIELDTTIKCTLYLEITCTALPQTAAQLPSRLTIVYRYGMDSLYPYTGQSCPIPMGHDWMGCVSGAWGNQK